MSTEHGSVCDESVNKPAAGRAAAEWRLQVAAQSTILKTSRQIIKIYLINRKFKKEQDVCSLK